MAQVKPTSPLRAHLAHLYRSYEGFLIAFCSVMFFLVAIFPIIYEMEYLGFQTQAVGYDSNATEGHGQGG